MGMDLSDLDKHLALLEPPKPEPPKQVPAILASRSTTLTARPWSVDKSGICPSCGKIMTQSLSLDNPVLLCEADRIVLPQPDNYVPPSQNVPSSRAFTDDAASSLNQLSYGTFADVPE